MRQQMLKNASENRKEEYNSKVGLAMLYRQSGGELTEEMAKIVKDGNLTLHIENLIEEIHDIWKSCENMDSPNKLSFNEFYNGFMGPYFGCYRCEDSQLALKAIDIDNDNGVDWYEFKVFLVWAGRQYPKA